MGKKTKTMSRCHDCCDFQELDQIVSGKRLCVCPRVGCGNYGFGDPRFLSAKCKTPKVLLGESVAKIIKFAGLGLVKEKKGCNCESRRKALNQYSWTPPDWVIRLLGMQAPREWESLLKK